MIGIRSRKKDCVSALAHVQVLTEDFFHPRAFINAHEGTGPLSVFRINHRHCNDRDAKVCQKRRCEAFCGGRFPDDPC